MTQLTIDRYVYARLLAIGITVLAFMAVIRRMYFGFRLSFDGKFIKGVVSASLGLALMTILYSVHDKVDQVMLERLAGDVPNGLYSAAYRWLEAVSMFLWTVLPIFFARFSFFKDNEVEQEKLLHFGQVITAIPLLYIAIWVWNYAELLLFPFTESTPEELEIIAACLRAIFVAVGINGCFAIFSTYLTSTGYEAKVNIMAIGSIALNIVLNFIFIPRYGAVACAWTTVLSYAFMSVAYLIYIEWKLTISIPYVQIVKLLLLGGIVFGGFHLLEGLAMSWYVVSILAFFLTILAAFLLGLLNRDTFQSFRV